MVMVMRVVIVMSMVMVMVTVMVESTSTASMMEIMGKEVKQVPRAAITWGWDAPAQTPCSWDTFIEEKHIKIC